MSYKNLDFREGREKKMHFFKFQWVIVFDLNTTMGDGNGWQWRECYMLTFPVLDNFRWHGKLEDPDVCLVWRLWVHERR